MPDIRDFLKERILVLDGAMGTMIQRHALAEADFRNDELQTHDRSLKGNNDLLSITRPNLILDIHRRYFESGADIVETNTFSSTSIAQEDYGLENWVYRMNKQSALLARQAADEQLLKTPERPRWVAGAMGPTNRTASLSPDVNDPGYRAVSFNQLKAAYREQVEGLLDGGVDLLLVETVFDTLNAKAALFAIQAYMEEKQVRIPVMVSGTITDASGRTLSGQTTEAFLASIGHVELLSVGLNCALGAEQLRPYLKILAEKSSCAVSAHPNAGLPNEFGEYEQSPDQMAKELHTYLEAGYVNILGGCCGTGPEHIKKIAELVSTYTPRLFDYKKISHEPSIID